QLQQPDPLGAGSGALELRLGEPLGPLSRRSDADRNVAHKLSQLPRAFEINRDGLVVIAWLVIVLGQVILGHAVTPTGGPPSRISAERHVQGGHTTSRKGEIVSPQEETFLWQRIRRDT